MRVFTKHPLYPGHNWTDISQPFILLLSFESSVPVLYPAVFTCIRKLMAHCTGWCELFVLTFVTYYKIHFNPLCISQDNV